MFEDEPHAEGAAVVAAAGEALQALCQELNLDEGSAAEALDDFTAIRGNYSLEAGNRSPEEERLVRGRTPLGGPVDSRPASRRAPQTSR
uniref:retinoblastoma-like protein 1 n=1 Tax=Halichoerus grypus TaxID=9711 RepID=UPI001659DCC6|nr:retinoblastoma-like protein 1 [Halichoerus grypus]